MSLSYSRKLLGLALAAALAGNAFAHGAPSRAPASGQEVDVYKRQQLLHT